ncbi:MAG: hypothetical protein CFE34_01490 [Rhodobacteraceae bacterium PARR1]|nr:MAG: hypothetical protein CFE34_01490 [Rhodobacteraceae bacterium PARR1]
MTQGGLERLAVVHVGLEKTGTTAVQAWLAARRSVLRAEGVLVPQSIGAPNQTRLVAACLDDAAVDNIKAHLMAAQARPAHAVRARVMRDFAAELAQGGWSRLVITSELISSRLHRPSEVDRLVAALRPHVDRIRFVLVLRRQADLALSRFSSALRAGHDRFDGLWEDLSGLAFRDLPPGRVVDDAVEYFDFTRILARFDRVDGAEVAVSLFDAQDPLGPVLRALGLPPLAAPLPRLNPALSAPAQWLIAALNRDHPVQFASGLRNTAYQHLLRRIEAQVIGPARQVARAEAESFQDRFAASNAALLDRTGLGFDTDFSRNPQRVDHGDLPARLAETLAQLRRQAAALPKAEPIAQVALRGLRQAACTVGLR